MIKFKLWNILFCILKVLNLRISQCSERIVEIKKDFAEDFVNEEITAISKAIDGYIPEKAEFLSTLNDRIQLILQSANDLLLSKTLKAIQSMI